MSYTVSTTDVSKISLNETDYVESVLQNIRVLLSTWQGDVPLYRDFGINPELLHRPINAVESLLIEDVTEKIEKYEPRATVTQVSFDATSAFSDHLGITVEVEVNAENE